MSQPEVTGPHGFWSVDDQSRYQWSRVASRALLQLSTSAVDPQALVQEFEQVCSLNDEQGTRIYHLEQALDQALLYLDELRLKIRDQGILETQLATTEEYASIQRQAIAQLKMQLERQQQAIEMYRAGMGDRDQVFSKLLERINTLAHDHTTTLEHFQHRLDTDRLETASHYSRLDTTIKELQTELENRQRQILTLEAEALAAHSRAVELEMQLNAAQHRIRELYTRIEEYSSQCLPADRSEADRSEAEMGAIAPLEKGAVVLPEPPQPSEVFPAWNNGAEQQRSDQGQSSVWALRVQELEAQVQQQTRQLAKLQQRNQEIEAERDRHYSRMSELDVQTAEMQEQILKQVQDAREYEAAIQHWKDRYALSQQHMRHVHEVLQRVLPEDWTGIEEGTGSALAELLLALQTALTPDGEAIAEDVVPSPPFSTLEVPDFLIRRRLRRPTRRPSSTPDGPASDGIRPDSPEPPPSSSPTDQP